MTDDPAKPEAPPTDDVEVTESLALEAHGMRERPRPPPPLPRTGVFVDATSLRTYVGDLLRVYLGHYEVDMYGNFTFPYETARVFVTVSMTPVGPQVGVYAVTNVEIPLTLELGHFLLTTNHQMAFGAFAYDEDNEAVWLRHALVGATLDAPELQATVAAIASTAAQMDHVIQEKFGGKRFDDASQAVQDSTSPPTVGATGYL